MLEYSPPQPWTGVRFVRVETIESPSWVAWSEIALYSAGSTPTGSLSGQVRSAEIPVVGAQVELRTGTEVVQTVFTDRDGAYAFVGIPPGAYSVRAYGPSPAYARVAEIGSQILGVRANLIVEPIVLTPR